jgi:pimeloyl-ACP methyl ester carboxylesterase
MKDTAAYSLTTGSAEQFYEFRSNHRFAPDVPRPYRLFAAALPCVCGVGCMYQAVASVRDRRSYPPPGRIYPVDGVGMHLQVAGTGAPTVVLETGLGGMSAAWGWIQPELAKSCRVVSYDRAGLGWSDADASPKTARRAVHRLRAILQQAGVSSPFVLVGHSMGGLLIRVFAACYPAEVAGMVLLDACHPDQHLRSTAIATHMRTGFRVLRSVPLLTRLGYVRLAGLFSAWSAGLPPRQAAEADTFLASYRHLRTTREESLAWEELCAEVRSIGGLGNLPLAVVTAGRDVLPGQPELQGELAALSRDSFQLAVRGADHVTLVTARDHALRVVAAITQVVAKGMRRSG